MALPSDCIDAIRQTGASWADTLEKAMTGSPEISVRLNRRKPGKEFHAEMQRVPWCPEGIYLPERPAFTFDPLLHQGAYYVQDASSMFIAHLVRHLTKDASKPLKVLDACAAPGGKTTAMIDALPDGSLVVANEYVPERAAILRENLAKWGYPAVCVTRGDTARFRETPAFFDIIAADVPCSGEGMMRKDAEAVAQWSPALVKQCAARQREIIANLWPALRPGGWFIYSTCTFNREENEDMIAHLRDCYGAEPVEIPVRDDWNIAPSLDPELPACRFIPGLVRGEGLFMAAVRKPLDAEITAQPHRGKNRRKESPRKKQAQKLPSEIKNWILPDFDCTIEADPEGRVTAVLGPEPYAPVLEIGEIKGRDIIPSQQLALSTALNPDAFPRVEIGLATAIDYLRREAITLPESAPRGLVLLTFAALPLGFVKNLGSRANNLYPRNWRILSRPV